MNQTASATVFLPTACAGPAWEFAREQMAQAQSHETPLEAIQAEMAIRDMFARYIYAVDQCDLDGVMQCFADDCIITNPRGRFVGAEAFRADLEQGHRKADRRLHLWSNVVVRPSADLRSGAVTAYFFAALERKDESPRLVGGLIADQVAKRDGHWRIVARSASADFIAALVPL